MGDAQGVTEELTVKLEEVGALDEIERLQEHDNDDVYKAALNIIETWFKDEEEDGDDNDPNQFNFAPPAAQPFSF